MIGRIVNEPLSSSLALSLTSLLYSAVGYHGQSFTRLHLSELGRAPARRLRYSHAPHSAGVSMPLSRSTYLSISGARVDSIISLDTELINYITFVRQLSTKDSDNSWCIPKHVGLGT